MINAEFVQVGAIIDYKVDNAVGYHEAVVIGDILGVTRKSGKKGDIVACDIEGVFRIKKKTGEEIKQGKACYFTTDGITGTKTGAEPKCISVENATSEQETILVKINA
ncbi:MAG: DUF2190 family protein [Dialister micraerophilus]|uniref:Uncharacterized protein n=1 Tax=Dialister micraerophilus UPII 345-E TaxID=910314 RepID=E4LA51_9FIRM|nr:DUF2190 family protein [Dialister micraerophilus]EFR42358.1 hypothetical protein HMPREF9220_0618 [Dialister micraerophilus UPII 345-E]MDK8253217.1 DUF2190 family protein [Dialister micraerophilus]